MTTPDYQCTESLGDKRCIKMIDHGEAHIAEDGTVFPFGDPKPKPSTPQPPQPPTVDSIVRVLREHTVHVGIMCSPGHWAYRVDKTSPDKWFAHCDGYWDERESGRVGCGWDTEPNVFATKQEAWEAAFRHIAEQILSDTAECLCNVGVQECPRHPGRLWDAYQRMDYEKKWDRSVVKE